MNDQMPSPPDQLVRSTLGPKNFNTLYLDSMANAGKDTALGRVYSLWWPNFSKKLEESDSLELMDSLDRFMDESRTDLQALAMVYARDNAPTSPEKQMQLRNQFLKSNTGKMFERFIGLTLAAVFNKLDLPYTIIPFNQTWLSATKKHTNLTKEDFAIRVTNCEGSKSYVDADLFLFSNADPSAFSVMVSIKSTLKDRFHNVPFWNLLRRCAFSAEFKEIEPANERVLANVYYVAICSDLAEEQPDFASEFGPRNLLQLDASLLDGAYVSASKAKGLQFTETCFGINRPNAFNPLTSFIQFLAKRPVG
jgi:hypothetical protein